MSERHLIVLDSTRQRDRAHTWVKGVPDGSRVEFKKPQRTLSQSNLMWVLLAEVSDKLQHHGRELTDDSWKLLFLAALHREIDIVPNLDGTGFVQIGGRSSSDLSKQEMSDLIELIYAYCAKHGVDLDRNKEGQTA